MRRLVRKLRGDSAGTERRLEAARYGTEGARPKVYLQAGLHADEMPGVLILQHLMDLLDAAETAGEIRGEIIVVPVANPIGLAQWQFQRPLGRQDAESMRNFNRFFPELDRLVGDRLEGKLTASADENRDIIRAAFRQALEEAETKCDADELRIGLMRWSCDADHVLDLHCDHHAILHLYASPARPEDTQALCRAVGARLALIQDVSGGCAFDEAHTVAWLKLGERFGRHHPIPAGCFSATLEYRGQFDVDEGLAQADAQNLMTYLRHCGALTGDIAADPAREDARHLPLGGAIEVFAPAGGIVTWACAPGTDVAEGEVIGHVTEPMARIRHPLKSPVAGMLFRQELWRSCLRGQGLAHVAGKNVLREGNLLSD
jgi:predicted deacylase